MIPRSVPDDDMFLRDWLVCRDEAIANDRHHERPVANSVNGGNEPRVAVVGTSTTGDNDRLQSRLERLTDCLRLLEADRLRIELLQPRFNLHAAAQTSHGRNDDPLWSDRDKVQQGDYGSGNTRELVGSKPASTAIALDTPLLPENESKSGQTFPRSVGRFQIQRRLGSGGFGMVFLATDPALQRPVAVKIPRPEVLFSEDLRKRFLDEARFAAQLDHHHIVPVHEAGESNGCLYLVSSYCPGPSLRDWMAEQFDKPAANGGITSIVAIEIVECLARAIAYCHQHGVLHRDLKPANVLLAERPCGNLPFTPKLTDFGLAKLMDEDLTVSGSGAMIGTPLYMSPEQACGNKAAINPATDVYSLGVILYELLTGRTPFTGNFTDVIDQLRRAEPAPPSRGHSHISPELNELCLRCLRKSPADRPSSAGELADQLQLIRITDALEGRCMRSSAVSRARLLVLAGTVIGASFLIWNGVTSNRNRDRSSDIQRTRSSRDEGVNGVHSGRLFSPGDAVVSAPVYFDGTAPMTIETWIQVQQHGGVAFCLSGLISLQFKFNETGCHAAVTINLSETDVAIIHSDAVISTDEWHHVAVVLSETRIALWLDGKELPTDYLLQAEGEDTVSLDPPALMSLKPVWPDLGLTIGSNDVGSSPPKRYPYSGRIRTVRVSWSARYQQPFLPAVVLTSDPDTVALYELEAAAVDRIPDASGQHGNARLISHGTERD